MKKSVLKLISTLLCLILALQFLLTAGIFAVQVSAATISAPSKVSGTYALRDSAFPHGNYVTCFMSVNSTEANSYASKMTTNGFTQIKKGSLGSCTYWHYTHANGVAFLVYDSSDSTLYVTVDDRTNTSAYTPTSSYTKITDTTLGIMSLDYSHGELGDGNGLCNIWILEDGSYLILDGGYEYDSQRLYNFLKDNNKRPDGQIVIHAWYFTHGHGDHYGAFQKFTTEHANDVKLIQVIASAAHTDDPLNANLLAKLAYYPGAKLVRPHTGETYQMPGLKMDILYTPEDLYVYKGTISAGNDSSIVSRVTVGGQTIMYTGDASTNACGKMINMYGSNLKSDFLQINHHGYGGGTTAFYQKVQAPYILWTSSQFGTERRTGDKIYQWIGSEQYRKDNLAAFAYTGNDYNKVFAADGAVELMTFPYNGNRDALPTYWAHDTRTYAEDTWIENFDALAPGTYTTDQLSKLLNWQFANTTGVTFTVTADKKMRITSAPQEPGVAFDFFTGVGTPSMNYGGDLVITMDQLDHFLDGRTVIEYDLGYHESVTPAGFGAAMRVTSENQNGAYWYEPTVTAAGVFHNRYRYNTNWQQLNSSVNPTSIPFNALTTDYDTDPQNKWTYDGYVVTDRFANWTDADGDGVYTSSIAKTATTIFNSYDSYKIVIDPINGVDFYVNGVIVCSSRIEDAWRDIVYDNLIGTRFGIRVMPGVDVTIDNLKIYREDQTPDLVITEIAPKGDGTAHPTTGASGWNEYIEVANNSDARINIYDYQIVKDNTAFTVGTLSAQYMLKILPGSTTWVAEKNTAGNNTVTHVNPAYEEGWLEPGECALLWVPTNTMYNQSSTKAGQPHTLADFRASYNLDDSTKAFVAYNNSAMSLNNTGSLLYAVGYANVDYVGLADMTFGGFVSYVYQQSAAASDFVADGTEKFTQTYPATYLNTAGSIRYYYPENGDVRHGKLLASDGTLNPGKLDDGQIKDANIVVLYQENFEGLTPESHTFSDSSDSTYKNFTFRFERYFRWAQMTPTDGSELEITADGKLRIYNPYYMTLERTVSSVSVHETLNYDFQIDIGSFEEMYGNKVVLEYDFTYNEKATTATSAAVFSFGRHVDYDRYCFAPAMTVQGFYQPRVGTEYGGATVHGQIRPEWIPYAVKNTGYNYAYGGVTNHYNVYGGVNHVKIEIDPYNGIVTYVNGVAISMVQDTAAWENLYKTNMGKLLGLSIAPGVEVVLDNINVYAVKDFSPEVIITEVGSAMGDYEYIEIYNNSTSPIDVYDYKLMRNTNLASGGSSGYTGIGTSGSNPIRWTNANVATILPGTHTYTAEASGQSVTLTNPESGMIQPGQTAILWIPSNTTYDDTTSTPRPETLETFMANYGLTDASKIFAAYNNNNMSLWDGGDIAYGIGYADVDYTTHSVYALNELVSYVYTNTSATTIYGMEEPIAKPAGAYGSVEYDYAHNNGVKKATFLGSEAGVNTIGRALAEQKRMVKVVIEGVEYEMPLGGNSLDVSLFDAMSLTTVYGASIRTSDPTGMRWMTAVNADDYATVQNWIDLGLIRGVELGTIIIRTRDLGDDELTLARVNGVDCFKVAATPGVWFEETPTTAAGYGASLVGTHIFAGSVTNIYREHYNVKYSAVGYMSITLMDGTTRTIYGGYSEEAHSRTVAEVAYRALLDPNNGLSAAEMQVIAGFAACYEAQ